MLITKNQGGPSKGIKLRRQKGYFTAHGANLTKGLAYPLSRTDLTDDLRFYKTSAVAAADDTTANIYVVPEADVTAGEDFWGVISGEVTMISAVGITAGDEVSIDSAGKVTSTIAAQSAVLGIALETASGADEEIKVELAGGTGFVVKIA